MNKFSFWLLLLSICYVNAQQSVFYSDENISSRKVKKFGVEVYNLNFIKNNEYFNYIADGYTLLATQIHPEFIYNPTEKTQFKAGAYIQKNYGENSIDEIIPTFSFNYYNGNHQFTFGNLFARNNHNLIEPVMASEKILTKNLIETGVDYKYNYDLFTANVWLNWERYIRKNDDSREFFTMGITGEVWLMKNKYHSFSLPISSVFYHRGGQINKKITTKNSQPLSTLDLNTTSLGLSYNGKVSEKSSLIFSYHYILSKVSNSIEEYPFKKGNAHYFIGTYALSEFEFSLAYFKGNKFISAKGNDMFQTYSTRANNFYQNGVADGRFKSHTEPNRSLLFLKANYKKELTKNIVLGLQTEGFYQLNKSTLLKDQTTIKNQFDFSYAFYLKFHDVFSF